MSTWPSIAVENRRLQEVAFDLRKRAERIGMLVSDCASERYLALEDVSPQATVPHEWVEFTFIVQDDAHPKVQVALSDANDFWLRVGYRPAFVIEGRLHGGSTFEFSRLIEDTLRHVQRAATPEEIQSLWRDHYDT